MCFLIGDFVKSKKQPERIMKNKVRQYLKALILTVAIIGLIPLLHPSTNPATSVEQGNSSVALGNVNETIPQNNSLPDILILGEF